MASTVAPPGAGAAGSTTRAGVAFAMLQAAVLAACAAQVAIDLSDDNLIAALLILGSSTATLQYLRGTRAFAAFPLSSFAVLGLLVTTQWGAIVTQSLAWTPIVDGLRDAVRTFGWLCLFQAVALAAHWLYRHLNAALAARDALSRRLLRPLGLFQVPSPGNLWVLGAVGFVSLFFTGIATDPNDLTKHVLDGFRFLAWAPLIIPVLYQRYGAAYCDMRRQACGIALYLLMAFALGMAINVRNVMFSGVTTAALLLLLFLLRDEAALKSRHLVTMAVLIVVGTLSIEYAADLATAMVIARDQRGNLPPLEMIEQTLYALFDPQVLQVYKDSFANAARLDVYDEYYIANPIVARFIETKFHDNMFFLIQGLQQEELAVLRQNTIDHLWSILPEPMLRALGVEVDKTALRYSFGDYFDYLRYGAELGSFKTGSVFAHGLALFGILFVPLYFVLCIGLFVIWDSLSYRTQPAPIAMLLAFPLFVYGITCESLVSMLSFFVRSFAQSVVLYVLAFAASKLLFKPSLIEQRRNP